MQKECRAPARAGFGNAGGAVDDRFGAGECGFVAWVEGRPRLAANGYVGGDQVRMKGGLSRSEVSDVPQGLTPWTAGRRQKIVAVEEVVLSRRRGTSCPGAGAGTASRPWRCPAVAGRHRPRSAARRGLAPSPVVEI